MGMGSPWKRYVVALLLFGVAFGYLEAAVVSYLRTLHEPVRLRYYPHRPASELFPLLTLDQIRATAPDEMHTINVEIGREAATLVMLAAIAISCSSTLSQWTAAFAIAFGAWDIAFYLFLKVILDWPASLFTWDILFLIPLPWTGPVIAPVLVSAAMITAGIWHFSREASDRRVHIRAPHAAGILAGALVIIVSFILDYRNIMAGGMPNRFNWPVFWAGMAIGALSYAHAALRASRASIRAVEVLYDEA